MVDIFQKMKNLFSGNKGEEPKIDHGNKLLSIIQTTGINQKNLEILTKNGHDEKSLIKSLKEIFFFKKTDLMKAQIEVSSVHVAFQVAKVLKFSHITFTYNPSFNLEKFSYKTGIKYRISDNIPDDFNGLVVCKHGENCENQKISLDRGKDLQFLSISNQNLGQKINEAIENREKIIGFSSSTSVLDAHLFGINQLVHNVCEISSKKTGPKISEMDLIQKFQNQNSGGVINFDEILFSLDKVEELAKTNMLASFGVKVTPEMKSSLSKQRAIIHSMTTQERKNPKIIDHMRIQRLSKGSGCSVDEVSKLVSMIEMIKQNGGKMASSMMNPAAMFNMNK